MRSLVLALALALAPLTAGATLIGDTVTVLRGADTGGGFSANGSFDILVAAGSSDLTRVGGTVSFPINFDAEADSFTITTASTGYGGGGSFVFNGYRITSLDWVGMPGAIITDISFTTDTPGLTEDRVTFSDHEVWIDFQGLSVNGDFITVELTTSVIPEPATAVLLGGGLLALAGARRRSSSPSGS